MCIMISCVYMVAISMIYEIETAVAIFVNNRSTFPKKNYHLSELININIE